MCGVCVCMCVCVCVCVCVCAHDFDKKSMRVYGRSAGCRNIYMYFVAGIESRLLNPAGYSKWKCV